MIVTLAVFVCYQIYRFALSHSVLMILLTLFDVVVIFLTWLEYGQQRSRRQTESPRTSGGSERECTAWLYRVQRRR